MYVCLLGGCSKIGVENVIDGYKFYYNSGGINRLLYYDVVEVIFI